MSTQPAAPEENSQPSGSSEPTGLSNLVERNQWQQMKPARSSHSDPVELPIRPQLHGWRFILVKPRQKAAIEKDWQGTANYDHDDPKLLSHIEAGGNYGILLGSGHVVVETDVPELERLVMEKLPPTFTVRSPGHGTKHFYFNGSCSRIIPILDRTRPRDKQNVGHVKCGPSYVVGPGSTHPNEGRYEIADDQPLASVTEKEILEAIAPFILQKDKAAEKAGSTKRHVDPNFSILQLVNTASLKRQGDEYYGAHPVHGSTTGHNFWLNPKLNIWHCFRCGSGGGPFSLLAISEGIIDCGDAVRGGLKGDDFKKTLEKAVELKLIKKPPKPPAKRGHGKTEPSVPLRDMVALPDWEADGRITAVLRLDKDQEGERVTSFYRVFDSDGTVDGEPLQQARFLPDTAPTQRILGTPAPSLGEIHRRLRERYERHLYLVNEIEYDLIALGAESTYFREIFEAYPYFDFLSVENGCGKTTALKCLTWCSFYGHLMQNPTSPVLFRIIEDTHGAVGIDQVDELFQNPKQNRDILTLLDSGHTKGIPAYRMNMDKNPPEPVPYDPFQLKGFTRTRYLPPDLLSRSVTIKMVENKGFKQINTPPPSTDFEELRDLLYVYRLSCHNEVADAYESLKEQRVLSGRVRDIFLPFLTMARLVSPDLYDRILDYARKEEEKRSLVKRDDRVVALVEYLVETGMAGIVPVINIRDELEKRLHAAKLLSENKELTSQQVIAWLDALGFPKSSKRAQGYIHYEIREDVLLRQGVVYLSPPVQTSLSSPTSPSNVKESEVSEVGEVSAKEDTGTPTPHELVLRKLESARVPMSWDYAVELAAKATGDRASADMVLNRLRVDGLFVQDPDGYWRLVR